jgi:hypothetical protein
LQTADPFTRGSALMPALCNLPIRGASLAAGDLRSLLSRGPGLSGFRAEAAIAQAYDALCRRPYLPAFRQAVTHGSGPTCEVAVAGPCCPPNALCLPPRCPPCPCGPAPCPVPLLRGRQAAIACPLQSVPVACPL